MTPETDSRSPERRAMDERIAAESKLAPLIVQSNTPYSPVESYLARQRRPIAIAGVVENGVVRPLDPNVKLVERSRVIIVASDED